MIGGEINFGKSNIYSDKLEPKILLTVLEWRKYGF